MSLSKEQRLHIAELMNRGEDLPADYQHLLFPPERREYELVYANKEREEDIIANTMAVPLQPVSVFGDTDAAWHNRLIFGDNLQAMATLLEQKKAGKLCNADGTPGVRLVYIDPPFATKQEFRGSQDQKAYQDKITGARFMEFLRKRLVMLRELLADDGSIYLHLDSKKGHYIKVLLDEVFGEGRFHAEIVWKRADSHNDSTNFGAVHDNIYFYSKSERFFFDSERVAISEKTADAWYRHVEVETGRRYNLGNLVSPHPRPNLTYEFNGVKPPLNGWRYSMEKMQAFHAAGLILTVGKTKPTLKIKQYLDESKGRVVTDWWDDISQLRGYSSSSEAVQYPTQKPEALLARVISTSSKEGDIVLDAFAGSGTTCAVAEKLGRHWIGVDAGKLSIYAIQKRMLNLRAEIGNKGKALTPNPFTVYNAGLYDFSSLRQLPWEAWRFFALQLFECKDEPHTVGGMQLDGKRKGHDVLVFNHHANPGQRITEETVLDIHARIGNKVGSRLYIIAPRGVFDFQQDYLEFDDVRYYALRIPYSFINELHARGFSTLRQPNDEMAVNDIVDAYGFDFIQPPTVKWSVGVENKPGQLYQEGYLQIEEFVSRARSRGAETQGGMDTLSMLMLDMDYTDAVTNAVFDFDMAFYAHQLQDQGWRAWFPLERLGAKTMAVFIDIHGNESRVLIPRELIGLHVETPTDQTATITVAQVN